MRPVAVPEDQLLATGPQRCRGGEEARSQGFMHEAPRCGRVELHSDEIVRSGIAQVEQGVREGVTNVDQPDGAGLIRGLRCR